MTTEHSKGEKEIEIFQRFLGAAVLPVENSTVEKRNPPEPDILYSHNTIGEISFELVEMCDPRLAKSIAKQSTDYLRTSDPSSNIISKKLRKKYKTDAPIELLCYTNGRIITPDDVILPTIKPYLQSWRHTFRRAWLLGRKGLYIVWDIE